MTTTLAPPEGPHADLIARLRSVNDHMEHNTLGVRLHVVDDALAALSDSVSREQYDKMFDLYVADANRMMRERDEALAVIEQVRSLVIGVSIKYTVQAEAIVISNVATAVRQAPADALARLKAEVWDDASRAHVEKLSHYIRDDGLIDQHIAVIGLARIPNPHRAAALREGAGS